MTEYRFDFPLGDQVLDNMDSINNGIKNVLHDLKTNVERSLAEWTGQARDEYWTAKAQWNAEAAKMPQSLQRARVAFNEITHGYDRAEKNGAEMWASGGW